MYSKALLFSSFITVAFAQTCYFRNGTAVPYTEGDSDYTPCSSDESSPLSHVCCSASRDTCLPNGLCKTLYTVEEGVLTYIYFRESCTLSNWENGGCQELCSDTPGQRADNANVTPCDGTDNSEQWCCGNSTACCGGDTSFGSHSVAPVFLGVVTSSSSSSVASSTSVSIPLSSSSSSSTPTPSPTTTPPPNDDGGGLSTGTKAGIGVGAALGVIALLALGAFLGRRSHKKKEEATEATTYYEPSKAEFPSETCRHEAPNHNSSMYEAPTTQKPAELYSVPMKPQELPGSGP